MRQSEGRADSYFTICNMIIRDCQEENSHSFNQITDVSWLGALQVTFWNVQQLMDVKREITPVVRRNAAKGNTAEAYAAFDAPGADSTARLQVTLHGDAASWMNIAKTMKLNTIKAEA